MDRAPWGVGGQSLTRQKGFESSPIAETIVGELPPAEMFFTLTTVPVNATGTTTVCPENTETAT